MEVSAYIYADVALPAPDVSRFLCLPGVEGEESKLSIRVET
jgi:hypothetical protein